MIESSFEIDQFKIQGYLAPKENIHGIYKNYSYLGDDSLLESDLYHDSYFVVGLYNNHRRKQIFNILFEVVDIFKIIVIGIIPHDDIWIFDNILQKTKTVIILQWKYDILIGSGHIK